MSKVHLFINSYSDQQRFRIHSHANGLYKKDVLLMEGATIGRKTTLMDDRDDTHIIVGVPKGIKRETIAWLYAKIVGERVGGVTVEDVFHHLTALEIGSPTSQSFSIQNGLQLDIDSRAVQTVFTKLDQVIQALEEFAKQLANHQLQTLPPDRLSIKASLHDDVLFLVVGRTSEHFGGGLTSF